jgi:dihydrofolate reductase
MRMPEVIVIAALARNRVIGHENRLCWNIPEDLARFRQLTRQQSVVMGRKTWESLPVPVRPLPGRQNIVVSRQHDFAAAGAQVASNLDQAFSLCERDTVFIIGGAQLYTQALSRADVLELTEVELTPEGDAFFPQVNACDWREAAREEGLSQTGIPFAFVRYVRNAAA